MRRPRRNGFIYPALFYDGLFPYQAYVRASDNTRDGVPHLAGYHDLRFVFCAAQGWQFEDARDCCLSRPPDGIRAWAWHAQQRVRT